MFKKLREKLRSLDANRVTFDPSQLDDAIAMQTDWTPAKYDGASFRTHRLVEVDSNRLEFRASGEAKWFYLLFLLVGTGMLVGFCVYSLSTGGFSFDRNAILPLSIGFVFTIFGGCLFYFGTAPIVFDKRKGYFWKGRKAPDDVFDRTVIKHLAELEEIHALQLISEVCSGSGDGGIHNSYELNLVLKNGKRINVVDHGKEIVLRQDAETISAFLEVPVWDAI